MGKRKEKRSEEKKNAIANFIELYDIQTAEDIQDALKDLLGGTIENMLKAELDNHLGYESYGGTNHPMLEMVINLKWLEVNMVS